MAVFCADATDTAPATKTTQEAAAKLKPKARNAISSSKCVKASAG
jgi:hypothetical protein